MPGPIQEQFGEVLIGAFADFARSDIKSAAEFEVDEFSHISHTQHRKNLARVFYGARWLYKLGLALLTRDEERAAHVRAQIVDYASVVEGLLSDAVAHAIKHGHVIGTSYRFKDPDRQRQPINWNVQDIDAQVGRQTLWWLIRVAKDSSIVSDALATRLHQLRKNRNDVHLRQHSALGNIAYLNQSRAAFEAACEVIAATKTWKAVRP